MESQNFNSWNLQARISKLLQDESSSDIEFFIGKSSERYFCHKVILAAGSPVFKTMFFGAIKQKSPVRVPDVTSKGFSLMLQYLYSDSLSIQDESEALEGAYVAKKYMINSMFTICECFLVRNKELNPTSFFSIYEEASFLEMKTLQDHCLRYVSRNTKDIFHCKSFLKISKSTFLDILRLDVMDIESETVIIEALWLWGEERCRDKDIKCTNENIRECTKEFLKHIRFFSMNMEELVDIFKKYQILDTSDELAVLWNFVMPSARKHLAVPSNISTKTKKRSFWTSTKILFPGVYRCDGNITTFLTENSQTVVKVTVTGSPVTVIGAVIAFKPIPCYSHEDRSLTIEIRANNFSSTAKTSVKSRLQVAHSNNEQQQLILLDEFIVVEEEQTLLLTVVASGEGVRFMQYSEEIVHHDLGKSNVCLKLDHRKEANKMLFPVKELMII